MGCAFVEKGGTDPAVNIAMGKFGEQFVLNVDILITEKKNWIYDNHLLLSLLIFIQSSRDPRVDK